MNKTKLYNTDWSRIKEQGTEGYNSLVKCYPVNKLSIAPQITTKVVYFG